MKILVPFSRIFVGILFIISGFIKLNDPLGFSYKLQEYFSAEVLNILIVQLQSEIKPETEGGHSGTTIKRNNKKYRDQLAKLEKLIAAMDGR